MDIRQWTLLEKYKENNKNSITSECLLKFETKRIEEEIKLFVKPNLASATDIIKLQLGLMELLSQLVLGTTFDRI